MAGPYVIPARDRGAFLRCRRAWDFGARERGNHQAAIAGVLVDRAAALRQALAVYYFPGMWDWEPGMVLRLVRMAYLDELSAQRDRYLRVHGDPKLGAADEETWTQARDEGLALLERYFAWAPTVDELSPVLVGGEFDVQVPDPRDPERGVVAPGGRAVHYRDRIDLLVLDGLNGYWLVEHRISPRPFPAVDVLRLSERCLSWCWAWELFYPGLRLEGTVFNELRDDGSAVAAGPTTPRLRGTVAQNRNPRPQLATRSPGPEEAPGSAAAEPVGYRDLEPVVVDGGEFRRVVVPRSRAELAAFGERIAGQLRGMVAPDASCEPVPTPRRCEACEFRAPCLSLNLGEDPGALLAAGYVQRSREPLRGQLGGGTWSIGRGAAPREFGGSS